MQLSRTDLMHFHTLVSAEIELSCTKMNVDQSMVSVVVRSIKICSMVDVFSTFGDKMEVGKRDLRQPYPKY